MTSSERSTTIHQEFDPFPKLEAWCEAQFGPGTRDRALQYLEPEWADLHWAGRLAEYPLVVHPTDRDGDGQALRRIAIVGILRERYFATVIQFTNFGDPWRTEIVYQFDSFSDAITAFEHLA